MSLAQRLREARIAKNYTYGELARLAGISSRQTVYNIEAGRQVASIEQVAKLAAALGVSPAWLAFGEGEMLNKEQKQKVLEWYLQSGDSKSVCEDDSILGLKEGEYRDARDAVDELLEKVFDLAVAALKRGEL